MFKKVQSIVFATAIFASLQPGFVGAMEKNEKATSNLSKIPDLVHEAIINGYVDLVQKFITIKDYNIAEDLFHAAVVDGNIKLVEKIINKYGSGIMVTYIHKDSLLGLAVTCGRLEIVKYLTNLLTEKQKVFALYKASECGHLPIVKYLLEKLSYLIPNDVDEHEKAYINDVVLIAAIINGKLNIVTNMLSQYPIQFSNINTCFKRISTTLSPLRPAVEYGQKEIVKYFIEKLGANANTYCGDFDLKEICAGRGFRDIFEYLEKWSPGLDEDTRRATLLSTACVNGQLEMIEFLLNKWKNFDINTKNSTNGRPALFETITPDWKPFSKLFYLESAFTNKPPVNDKKKLEIIKRLINKGADLNIRLDLEEITPLDWAVQSAFKFNTETKQKYYMKTIKLLIHNGARIVVDNKNTRDLVKKLSDSSTNVLSHALVTYLTLVEDFDKVVNGTMTMQNFCTIYLGTTEKRKTNLSDIKDLALSRGSYKIFKQLTYILTTENNTVVGTDAWYTQGLRSAIEWHKLQFTLDLLADKPQLCDTIDEIIKLENKKTKSSDPAIARLQDALRKTDKPFKQQLANFLGQKNALVGTRMDLGDKKYTYLTPGTIPKILGFITNQPAPIEPSSDKKRKNGFGDLKKKDLKKLK